MKFLLNEHIVFDFDTSTIFTEESPDDPIQISNPAKRLLYLLLSHSGEVVCREVLFKKVWDDFGMVSSNNNLNQCISKLRRILRHFNQNEEIIITVPKVGFMLNKQIVVEELVDHAPPIANTSAIISDCPTVKLSQYHRQHFAPGLWTCIFAACCVSISLILLITFLFFNSSHHQDELLIGSARTCAVRIAENAADLATLSSFKKDVLQSLQQLNLHCNHDQYILLVRNESLTSRTLGVSRYSPLLCEKIISNESDICLKIQISTILK
ncbi:winged helix-turn-helix domain-containing protein [Klebsiella aerogenes]|uniref:transcriptional regulator n=1 Tax=Klebsiella TaxID=570 RepID=UPI0027F051E7|nr:winged helix-turn-helix domain-containing protein [Klebsiella aerogenes]EKZ9670451.1 winged helix-turn-helix domain-containing protein [Klebsiella aerogenes]MDQ8581161.1 winged helix-turn-helix domain-containing protein [Klebsiella aerogenes]HCR0142252.1 winged helix-turn-helix domain-containing protein [Klebsiella aerogenes]